MGAGAPLRMKDGQIRFILIKKYEKKFVLELKQMLT